MVILASDIGSTTTKLVAFELQGGDLRELGSVQEPTTVEAPHSDVCVGLFRALKRLGELTGLELSGPGGYKRTLLHHQFSRGEGCRSWWWATPGRIHAE